MPKYWIKVDRAVEGPYEAHLLKYLSGFSEETLVSPDALDDDVWTRAIQVREIFPELASPVPPPSAAAVDATIRIDPPARAPASEPADWAAAPPPPNAPELAPYEREILKDNPFGVPAAQLEPPSSTQERTSPKLNVKDLSSIIKVPPGTTDNDLLEVMEKLQAEIGPSAPTQDPLSAPPAHSAPPVTPRFDTNVFSADAPGGVFQPVGGEVHVPVKKRRSRASMLLWIVSGLLGVAIGLGIFAIRTGWIEEWLEVAPEPMPPAAPQPVAEAKPAPAPEPAAPIPAPPKAEKKPAPAAKAPPARPAQAKENKVIDEWEAELKKQQFVMPGVPSPDVKQKAKVKKAAPPAQAAAVPAPAEPAKAEPPAEESAAVQAETPPPAEPEPAVEEKPKKKKRSKDEPEPEKKPYEEFDWTSSVQPAE